MGFAHVCAALARAFKGRADDDAATGLVVAAWAVLPSIDAVTFPAFLAALLRHRGHTDLAARLDGTPYIQLTVDERVQALRYTPGLPTASTRPGPGRVTYPWPCASCTYSDLLGEALEQLDAITDAIDQAVNRLDGARRAVRRGRQKKAPKKKTPAKARPRRAC